jgi:hypothetical protein
MGTELPAKVMLGQTLVLMQMTFLNNVRKVDRLVLSRTFVLTLPQLTFTDGCLIQLATRCIAHRNLTRENN